MRNFLSVITLLSLALALSFSAVAFNDDKAAGKEVTLTGCLSKGPADGDYILTAGKGEQAMVTGSADLEKHAANKTVRVTGTWENAGGKKQFKVSKIEPVSDSCQAPPAGN